MSWRFQNDYVRIDLDRHGDDYLLCRIKTNGLACEKQVFIYTDLPLLNKLIENARQGALKEVSKFQSVEGDLILEFTKQVMGKIEIRTELTFKEQEGYSWQVRLASLFAVSEIIG